MRAGDLNDFGAHVLELVDGLAETGLDAGLEALAAEFLDEADLHALQIALGAFAGGGDHRTRAFGDGGGVTLVVATDDLLQQCGVEHGAGDRADLVERGGHGDGSETGDAAVGGFDAHGAGQGAGLANRSTGVGAEGERGLECGDRGGGATTGTAGHALGIPRVVGGLVGGVLGGGALGEFVEVRLAEDRHAGGLELFDDGGVVRRHPALEDLGGGGGFDALGDDHVLDGDRHTSQLRQGGLVFGGLGVEGVGLLESHIAGNLQEGLDRRLSGFDHLEVGFDELARGDVALLDGSGLLGSRQFDKSCGFVAHRLLLASQDSRCHEHAGLGLRATGERLFLRERGFGDVRAQVGFQRNRVGGRRHIVGGDFLDLVDGVCDDVQFALQTGDFLIGERDSGQIAQMHDFFA